MQILAKYRPLNEWETEAAWSRNQISLAASARGDTVTWSPWEREGVLVQDDPSRYDMLYIRNFGKFIPQGRALYDRFQALGKKAFADFPKTKREIVDNLLSYGMGIDYTPAALSELETNPQYFVGKVVRTSRCGRRGSHTYYPRSLEQVQEIAQRLERRERKYGPLLVSEYLPNDGDYRAVVIGGQCLGVNKRGPKRLNRLTLSASRGKSANLKVFAPQLAAAAQAACIANGIFFGSVDLLLSNGSICVVEANESPCFRLFQKRSGIKVAQFLMEFFHHA